MKKINERESVWGRVLLHIQCQGRPFQGGDIWADHLNNEKEPAWEECSGLWVEMNLVCLKIRPKVRMPKSLISERRDGEELRSGG